MAQPDQPPNPVATLQGLFPAYQAPSSPLQAAQHGFQAIGAGLPQPSFMKPTHVRPNSVGFTPGQTQSLNTLSSANLPTLLQMLGRR